MNVRQKSVDNNASLLTRRCINRFVNGLSLSPDGLILWTRCWCIVDIACRDFNGTDLQSFLIYTEVELAPKTFLGPTHCPALETQLR